jgi:hypothetical protein
VLSCGLLVCIARLITGEIEETASIAILIPRFLLPSNVSQNGAQYKPEAYSTLA